MIAKIVENIDESSEGGDYHRLDCLEDCDMLMHSEKILEREFDKEGDNSVVKDRELDFDDNDGGDSNLF